MPYRLSQNSLKHSEGVDERLIWVRDYAIAHTVVDFGIPRTGGLRTQDMQKELYDEGLSLADGTINKSDHQTGFAIDFFPYANGATDYSAEACALVAAAWLEGASTIGVPLKWGGLWGKGPRHPRGFTDMPHLYIPERFR